MEKMEHKMDLVFTTGCATVFEKQKREMRTSSMLSPTEV